MVSNFLLQIYKVSKYGCGIAFSLLGIQAAHASKPEPWQLGLPEPVTPIARDLLWFHNDILLPLAVGISVFVLALLIYVCIRYSEKNNPIPSNTTHNTKLEILWTGIPIVILVLLAIPSLRLLYATDDVGKADMVVKVTGYQWYWNYEYVDEGIEFDAYMVDDQDIEESQKNFRLMLTDNQLVLPLNKRIKFIITSGDVLHSWSLSDFGVRLDAVPGRLNETWALIEKPGEYFGFCSELCGQGHSFMPIHVKVLEEQEYRQWLEGMKDEAQAKILHENNIKSTKLASN